MASSPASVSLPTAHRSQSARTPPPPVSGPALELCTRCQAFIVQYFSEGRQWPESFEYRHAHRLERKQAASNGCKSCALSLEAADGDEDHSWLRGTLQQATVNWTNYFEFYEPGRWAIEDERHQHPEFENAYDFQKDAPPRTDDPACFALAGKWLENCCSQHHPNCHRPADPLLPTRVIDVGSDVLDNGQAGCQPYLYLSMSLETARYVALSHRWEANLAFKTTSANIDQHRQAIPLSTLPQTFRDAVVVCRKLGIRYLWIDAICIIQDSREDWESEANRMAYVYREAAFTISASDSSSSEGGLFRQRAVRPSVTFTSPLTGVAGEGKPPVIGMRVAAPTFDDEMRASPLSARGWIYQERALSTATLHYGATQMLWECRRKVTSEYSSEIHDFTQGLTYDFGRVMRLCKQSPTLRMPAWEDIVRVYTRKRLTIATDRLPAISAVVPMFGGPIPGPAGGRIASNDVFLDGLWLKALHKQLLWTYDIGDEANVPGPAAVKPIWVPPGWKPRLPSWTWVSVDYPVSECVDAAVEHLDHDFKVLDPASVLRRRLLARGLSIDGFELSLQGKVTRLAVRAERLDRQTSVKRTACLRHAPYCELAITVDPGCSIPAELFIFRVATYPGSEPEPLPKAVYFLLLEREGGISQRARFRRIGVGTGSIEAVDEAFREIADQDFELI